jgi:hypothetical protein
MKTFFSRLFNLFIIGSFLFFSAFSQVSCSRKSGCPADDVQTKTDASGIPKAKKAKSGLLPPNAHKKKKKS